MTDNVKQTSFKTLANRQISRLANPFMRLLRRPIVEKFRLSTRIAFRRTPLVETHFFENFPSRALEREVRVTVLLPPGYFESKNTTFPLLFFNDGQDMEEVGMADILENLYQQQKIRPLIVVALHADRDRMQEYGTAHQPDYRHRGARAALHTQFVTQELIPTLRQRYRCTPADWAYAGFSLGGLSAFDVAWHHPALFSKIGVFSGSFWWRSEPSRDADPDAHRIVIDMLATDFKRNNLQFWLQTGTNDETDDRNGNGVIDSIDDTLDVIKGLKKLGYQEGKDIRYVEVEGGEHNLPTWRTVLPDFLQWGFGN